jgi:hemolysin D
LSLDQALSTVREFQSETEAIRQVKEPLRTRITLYVLVAFVLSGLFLITVTKLDRVVQSQGGKIVPLGQVAVYQALDQAIIKSIDVREGDQVKPGQLLATLDPTFAAADVAQYKAQVASDEAQILRDEAELAGKPFVYDEVKNQDTKNYYLLQKALYVQRVAQYNAQINSFDSKIKQTEATVTKLSGDDSRYRQREDIAQKIEDMRTTLAQHGTGSQLNMFSAQDTRLELVRTIENTHNSLIEAQGTLASIAADRDAFKQQWFAQLSQELVKTRNDLDTARASYDKAIKRQDLVKLTASEPAVVLTIAKLSVGSVLKPSDELITMMPLNTALEAEIKISSRDVGYVRPKDPCVLSIEAFNAAEHGTAEGVVRWISEGAFTLDEDNKPVDAYYKARCSVDTARLVEMPNNFRLLPGMTLTGDIKVGRRSVAMYLIGGMLRGFGTSMREP